ncbi:sodium/calcium exchanger protein [Halalkalicoccus jeotgali]|uniref:Sodium/calcium exchanger membrane region n=1 Tax=Halalkalicoccus jeotgali (strain DSM 18796 / CECT 7217 / JCM 14584 / KCTC 4019 / B3) TaxID=795797 RepID=D8J6W1_HALJB|nr:sodium:calcium antiporter [Halalkalicoccus jeotgali]ADJ15914.1 sodium/calcium exchanger membrane region [Halalkalicoccus jeotgali B3]ELY38010.1 sodium/calcium exchanger membrane subunit [Halalkalicoccus jeotgali B3]
MLQRFRHPLVAVVLTFVLTVPWVYTWFTHGGHVEPGAPYSAVLTVAVSGIAVLGSSFLLAWGAETAEKDVPRAFAIAVLAVLAVAPEYAVDALYAWQAGSLEGTQRGADAANLAVANMTGANRILIGLGWSAIALFTVYRAGSASDPAVEHREGRLRNAVSIDRDLSVEIAFLFAATAFAFVVPFSMASLTGGGSAGGIGLFDTAVLVGLYVLYILIIARGDVEEHEEQVGVPAYFQSFPKPARIGVVLSLFAYSGAMIYTAVHPFAMGLETIGIQNGIPEFFMIQWIAPLASESPELIVVAYLVNKARSTAGFNALISSKLNQWTLLIGTLAVVYSIAAGHLGALPFDQKQVAEIWITAAQSLFALAILSNFEISVREALVLLVLFVSQVAIEFAVIRIYPEGVAEALSLDLLYGYTAVYLLLGGYLLVTRRGELRNLFARAGATARSAVGSREVRPGGAD